MKSKEIKLTTEQRLVLFWHEQAHRQQNIMSKFAKPMDTQQQVEAKQKQYFSNFPFDEQATRDFLGCFNVGGYFEKHDVKNDELSDMLRFPDYKYGFRILNVTVGKGTHNTMMYGGDELLDQNYEVNENEVYITYNTQQMLSGGKFTVVMKRENGKNEIIKQYTHSRS